MDNNSQGIYDLITKLCEKYASSCQSYSGGFMNLRKIRSRCYEIMLLKKTSEKSVLENLENNVDPYCHLLAWEFQLRTEHNLPQHAGNLSKCCEKLQDLDAFNNTSISSVLTFLLELRKIPQEEKTIIETTLDKRGSNQFFWNQSAFAFFEDSKFQLADTSGPAKNVFEDDRFKLHTTKHHKVDMESVPDLFVHENQKQVEPVKTKIKDEGYESPKADLDNIWEIASRSVPNEHYTWESYGSTSLKEPPFLCEAGSEATNLWLNLSSSVDDLVLENNNSVKVKTVMRYPQFIKDMKYLLVGMESRTFRCDEKGELFLFPGRCVEGLSASAIESYSNDFLVAGNCYKGLNTLCTVNPSTQSYVHNGYIFMELCQGIRRYLSFYRVAALSISDSTPLLAFHEQTKQLRTHVTVLASVCKVGPFSESAQIPQGVALLNYLYQKVMTTANRDVIMVLYSILYPCCQVYFTRFLQQWMLEGSLQDPYNEFFIKSNSKYLSSRGRTYWTKSFSMAEDVVPDFLVDLKNDILLCGKSINLLKLCVPNSPLCLYMMDKQPNIISCCVLAEQLSKVELNNHYYYLEATALSGPRISFSQIITSLHGEDNMLLSLIAKKRVATLNRIELERKKEIEDHVSKKRKSMKILQEKYVEAQSLRKMHLIQQIEDELKTLEQEIRLQTLHNQVLEEERTNLIEYYNKLFNAAESRKKLYDQRTEKLRTVQLENKDNYHVKLTPQSHQQSDDVEKLTLSSSSSTETFVTIGEDLGDNKSDGFISADTEEGEFLPASSARALTDELNGNSRERSRDPSPIKECARDQHTINYLAAVGNFQDAKRNKEKIMGSRSNIALVETKRAPSNEALTDAQRNKMRVMASEYGSSIFPPTDYTTKKVGKRPKTAPQRKGKTIKETAQKEDAEESSLTIAQRNKLKILSLEFGSYGGSTKEHDVENEKPNVVNKHNSKKKCKNSEPVKIIEPEERITNNQADNTQPELTEAQRNKLKVMAAEFGQDYYKPYAKQTEKNQNINFEIYTPSCDNENYINRNTDNTDTDLNANFSWAAKKQDSLSLDFTKLLKEEKRPKSGEPCIKSPKFELDRISPMSVDSTPLSSATTPSRFLVGFENTQSYTNTATATASPGLSNQGFEFEINNSENRQNLEHRKSVYNLGAAVGNVPLSKNITVKDATLVSPNCLKLCLQQSLTVPLITQLKLVNNELLKYFINDLEYLNQVNVLRNYFFLLDGEFGRNITEQLFAKLYDANFPVDLINHHTLQGIMFKALDCSTNASQKPTSLSFKINSLPAVFNLGDPDVFDCISLTFKPQWPLNILLPTETISKYDEIFKFLLQLQRVAWVLQNLFQNLKSLMKEAEFSKSALLTSPHYRRLHQCRHVMTHFIQTLQGYVIGEVVLSSWEAFEKNLETVITFDQLYSFHTLYIKNILFMCLLNQKSAPLRKVLQKIFTVIFKFYDYARSRDWNVENDVYVHPNFKKLEDIFTNFEELTQYLFKVGHKVVQSGYQPHLLQLLDMLDLNNYYSNKNSDFS